MAILGAIEKHELFENCFMGGKKYYQGLQKGQQNEVVKVKLPVQSPSHILQVIGRCKV